jgi:hypothetical protein
MESRELVSPARGADVAGRSLLLVWQEPASRKFLRVARFSQLSDGRFAFEYDESAAALPSFYPLAEFPDFKRTYIAGTLPAFFANRIMSHDRPSYGQYLDWLGLEPGADTPMELLARTGGGRATDTFHLVDAPMVGDRMSSRFFVSGVRHIEGAAERLRLVNVGDELKVRPEPQNPVDPRALLIDVESGDAVGWVPNWLLDEVHRFLDSGHNVHIVVERLNLDAPDHLKLLARIDAP